MAGIDLLVFFIIKHNACYDSHYLKILSINLYVQYNTYIHTAKVQPHDAILDTI